MINFLIEALSGAMIVGFGLTIATIGAELALSLWQKGDYPLAILFTSILVIPGLMLVLYAFKKDVWDELGE